MMYEREIKQGKKLKKFFSSPYEVSMKRLIKTKQENGWKLIGNYKQDHSGMYSCFMEFEWKGKGND